MLVQRDWLRDFDKALGKGEWFTTCKSALQLNTSSAMQAEIKGCEWTLNEVLKHKTRGLR